MDAAGKRGTEWVSEQDWGSGGGWALCKADRWPLALAQELVAVSPGGPGGKVRGLYLGCKRPPGLGLSLISHPIMPSPVSL